MGRALVVVVSAAIVGGIVRQARRNGWKPVHFVLPAYAAVVLFWNFSEAERFFLPFIPLFVAGVWFEGKNILKLAGIAIVRPQSILERVVAVALGLIITVFGGAVLVNFAGGLRTQLAETSRERGLLLAEKQEAYQWLSRATPNDARVVADEDASLYLYSDRSSMRPIVFTTAEFYDPSRLEEPFEHMMDVPRAIGADYWVFADDDYGLEWWDEMVRARVEMGKLERVLPIVYKSRYGHVRVRYLGCIRNPQSPSCCSADRVLFPAGYSSNSAELASH